MAKIPEDLKISIPDELKHIDVDDFDKADGVMYYRMTEEGN